MSAHLGKGGGGGGGGPEAGGERGGKFFSFSFPAAR